MANLDPATNARHARENFLEAGGWRPWSTFLHDTYLRFLDRGRNAVLDGAQAAGQPAGGQQAGAQPAGGGVHVVRDGETLGGIAVAHGLSFSQLEALNPNLFDAAHRHGNLIHAGERVIVGAGATVTGPTVVRHIIRQGETRTCGNCVP